MDKTSVYYKLAKENVIAFLNEFGEGKKIARKEARIVDPIIEQLADTLEEAVSEAVQEADFDQLFELNEKYRPEE